MTDLIDAWMHATDGLPTAPQFRKWGALGLTSCLLGRRVWTSLVGGKQIFPNIYVLLLGPSGSGKSTAINAVSAALRPYKGAVTISPQAVTAEKMVEDLGKSFKRSGGALSYACLAGELGTFLETRDRLRSQLQMLADIWDCPEEYARSTRTRGTDCAVAPFVTAMWGAQPAIVELTIPPVLFDLGLPARTHFIMSDRAYEIVEDWGVGTGGEPFEVRLVRAVRRHCEALLKAAGHVEFSPDAKAMWEAWRRAGQPRMDGATDWDAKSQPYADRRRQHLAKLCILVALARHPAKLEVLQEDLEMSLSLLWEAEADLPRLLSYVGLNPDRRTEDEVVDWVRARGEVPEIDVRNQLRQRVRGTREVGYVLEELINTGLLVPEAATRFDKPNRRFRAGERR